MKPTQRSSFALHLIMLLSLGLTVATAQHVFLPDEKLIPDSAITIGAFDNGLTYYIKTNAKPEKRAELRLVVKAGSVLEDKDQLGLAHLCEHMAFNGTKSFPKNEIINLLEHEGVRLGPDVNAYTSFDETVYMLQIPTDSLELVEKAFKILEEWASAVTYDQTEIDKERGVVVEEWRLGRGAFQRVMNKHYPIIFHDSRYAERLPIGEKDILEHCSYETLRKFYRDWYRPELMAVVAVGDFDKNTVHKMIVKHFSGLVNRRPARKRTVYAIPDNKQTLVSIAKDKELPISIAYVFYSRDQKPDATAGDYRTSVLNQLYDGMFNNRIQERLHQPNPPFVFGFGTDGRWIGGKQVYQLIAQIKETSILDGVKYLLTEAYRVNQHGFTATELERQKKEQLRRLEQLYKEKDKTESSTYANEYVRNFLQKEPIPGLATEYRLNEQFMPGITLEEINRLTAVRLGSGRPAIAVSAPEKEGVVVPTDAELTTMLKSVATTPTAAYVDKVVTQPLLAALPAAGTVVSERSISSLGLTEWKLSNGSKVVLKPTDFKNDEILFSAYSPGGTSLSTDADFMSARTAGQVVSFFGAGPFDAVTLQKMLAGKIVSVYPGISELSEGFDGRVSPEDLETLFQLTYLYGTAPRRDSSAFGALMSRMLASIQSRSASPEGVFYDTVNVTMTQHHFRTRPFTATTLSEVDLDKALAFYRDRFSDFGDFTFFFVGNFKPEAIRPMVERYLASLPTTHRTEWWRDVGIFPPKGIVSRTVYKGVDPKSQIQLGFTGPFDWAPQSKYNFSSLMEFLNIKLREVIREEKSGTYGIRCFGSPSLYPRKEYTFTISWGCDPTRVDELVATVMQQIDSVRNYGPQQSYVEKVKEIQKRNREVNLKENQFWMSSLRQYYANSENPEQLLDYDSLVSHLTTQAIQEAATKYLDTKNYVKVVLIPEKGKTGKE